MTEKIVNFRQLRLRVGDSCQLQTLTRNGNQSGVSSANPQYTSLTDPGNLRRGAKMFVKRGVHPRRSTGLTHDGALNSAGLGENKWRRLH
jgi:hypothetical protein